MTKSLITYWCLVIHLISFFWKVHFKRLQWHDFCSLMYLKNCGINEFSEFLATMVEFPQVYENCLKVITPDIPFYCMWNVCCVLTGSSCETLERGSGLEQLLLGQSSSCFHGISLRKQAVSSKTSSLNLHFKLARCISAITDIKEIHNINYCSMSKSAKILIS